MNTQTRWCCGLLVWMLAASCLHGATFEQISLAEGLAYFEENVGQAESNIKYIVRGTDSVNALTDSSLLNFSRFGTTTEVQFAAPAGSADVAPANRWPGTLNYFSGPVDGWRRNIPAFQKLTYNDIYPNIDVTLTKTANVTIPGQTAESVFSIFSLTFIVHPGGDVSSLLLRNADERTDGHLSPDGEWSTEARGGYGLLRFASPRAWQESAGGKTALPARFVVTSGRSVGIDVGGFDNSRELFLETHVDSNFSGPGLRLSGVDETGTVYLAGGIQSRQPCGIRTGGVTAFCGDAIIAAFGSDGTPVFLTTMAGKSWDAALDLDFNEVRQVVVTGSTDSEDFPVTPDAFQPENAGPLGPSNLFDSSFEGDVFIAQLDSLTGNLTYSTFFGGAEGEGNPSLRVSSAGIALFAFTTGDEFPTTSAAWMPQPEDCSTQTPCINTVVARLDLSLRQVEYASYLPPGDYIPHTFAIHSDGSIYVAATSGGRAPTTEQAFQREIGGQRDIYLARLAPDGSHPLFATFLGGPGTESVNALVVDNDGNVGLLLNSRPEPFNATDEERGEAAWISPDGRSIIRRYPALGLRNVFRSSEGQIVAMGSVRSPARGTSVDAPLRASCSLFDHMYVTSWADDGTPLNSTYLPPAEGPLRFASRASASYVAATPELVYWLQRYDLTRVDLKAPNEPKIHCVTGAASRKNFATVSPGEIITIIGAGIGPQEGVVGQPISPPFEEPRFSPLLAGVQVWVGGIAAPLLYAQSSQINAVTPFGVPSRGEVTVEVEFEGNRYSTDVVTVPAAASLFALDSSGSGRAAAFNQDGTLNSASNPARRGSIVVLYGTGVGETDPPLRDGGLGPFPPAELARPVEIVRVTIGGSQSDILYAGSAPGLINGAMQFNLRVPPALRIENEIDSVSVGISVGDATPRNSVTLWLTE